MAILTPNTLWPPVVKVCIAWLQGKRPEVPAVVNTTTIYVAGQSLTLSAAVAKTPGVVQVLRTPGRGMSANDLDELANLDLYFYAKDVGSVETLAQWGHSAILQLAGRSAAGWRIDEVRTEASPGEVAYSDPTVERWVGSYQIVTTPQR